MSSNAQGHVYQVHAAALELKPDAPAEDAIRMGVERALQSHIGKPVHVTRIKPELDERGEVVSYAVWVQE
jgi:hypothetical protein